MMKQLIIAVAGFLPLFAAAQHDGARKGIIWNKSNSWKEIQATATREQKYIFVDCYATWCGPCKVMDREVYVNDTVGDLFNNKFVSVKMQMDVTPNDNEEIIAQRQSTNELKDNYKVSSFPTYLFFLPDGRIIGREKGQKSTREFVNLANAVLDSNSQVYSLIERFHDKSLDYARMPELVDKVKTILGNRQLELSIAQEYLTNFLYKLDNNALLTKEPLGFISAYIQNTSEKGFELFYHYPEQVDKVMRPGFSKGMVEYLIAKTEIDPVLAENRKNNVKEPKWEQIRKSVTIKYNKDYADRLVMNAQLSWYESQKNWDALIKYNKKKIEVYGIDTSGMGRFFLNNTIWRVFFLHAEKKADIEKSIGWMEEMLKLDSNSAQSIDTYANLLHKIGRTNDAIAWEERAVQMDQLQAKKFNVTPNPVYQQTVEKMRRKEPTWMSGD